MSFSFRGCLFILKPSPANRCLLWRDTAIVTFHVSAFLLSCSFNVYVLFGSLCWKTRGSAVGECPSGHPTPGFVVRVPAMQSKPAIPLDGCIGVRFVGNADWLTIRWQLIVWIRYTFRLPLRYPVRAKYVVHTGVWLTDANLYPFYHLNLHLRILKNRIK